MNFNYLFKRDINSVRGKNVDLDSHADVRIPRGWIDSNGSGSQRGRKCVGNNITCVIVRWINSV